MGAMERMYQRIRFRKKVFIMKPKSTRVMPLIGVNTFLNKKGSPTVLPGEVIRSTTEEKEQQIQNLKAFKHRNEKEKARPHFFSYSRLLSTMVIYLRN